MSEFEKQLYMRVYVAAINHDSDRHAKAALAAKEAVKNFRRANGELCAAAVE